MWFKKTKIKWLGFTALFLALVVLVLLIIFVVPVLKPKDSKPIDRPNIVLVILDTVRYDYTSLELRFGEKEDLTPHLKRLASESTVFPNTWSNAPWTVPSHASMFTGLLPSQHACTSKHSYLENCYPTIAEILRKSGFETAGFFSNPWLNNETTGLMRGFQTIKEVWVGGLSKLSRGMGNQGGLVINRNIHEWLKNRTQKKPFFLFVNYLEAHLPYDPNLEYREKHLKKFNTDDAISIKWAHEFNAGLYTADKVDWKKVRKMYAGDVHTADSLLGTLLQILKESGVYDNTIIIVTSDHGENLGEHGLMEHQFSVHENVLLVPLVIRAPGILKPGINLQPVMLSDLFDTIIELAGVEYRADGDTAADTNPVFSQSLLPTKGRTPSERKRYVVSEYAGAPGGLLQHLKLLNPELDTTPLSLSYKTVTDGKWRFTISSDGKRMLYNLDKDPQQTIDYSSMYSDIADEMEGYLETIFSVLKQTAGKPIRQLDEETKKRLKSLGYIQ
jgi:arylsulfatase A-like enzyme